MDQIDRNIEEKASELEEKEELGKDMVDNIIAARGLGPQMGMCDKKKDKESRWAMCWWRDKEGKTMVALYYKKTCKLKQRKNEPLKCNSFAVL
jgi:hypothetical protein